MWTKLPKVVSPVSTKLHKRFLLLRFQALSAGLILCRLLPVEPGYAILIAIALLKHRTTNGFLCICDLISSLSGFFKVFEAK